ncbi:hypothetical protein Btru_064908 [Bulinus truncatus]|nr:hypothetical protein Btru_064908 [Bulinus truncatus]
MNQKMSKKVEGSMPCGNPKRFESRDVLRMPQERSQHKKMKVDGPDPIETQSEKHLHVLLDRQVKKDFTFTDQFSRHRSFTPATSHDPGVEKLVGVHGFVHYRQVSDLDSKIDYLRHCGLSDEEVTLWLQEEMQIKPSTGYGAHPASKSGQLLEIQKKIQDKEKSLIIPDKFQGALELSRQERDLEKSIVQKFGRMSDLPVIVTEKKFKETHPDDPINHISEILNGVETKVEREPRRDRRRRRKMEKRKLYYDSLKSSEEPITESIPNDQLVSADTHHEVESQSVNTSCNPNGHSIHTGLISPEDEVLTLSNDSCERLTESSEQPEQHNINKNYIQETNTRKEITGPINFISRDDIEKNRLSLDEIKAVDKFRNFSFGEPNKVIYVKNLHPKTTDEELVALFGLFQAPDKPHIIFKRLTGRMNGQAFITFPDEVTAREAIQLINGYKLRDRPVILSYGRKTVS